MPRRKKLPQIPDYAGISADTDKLIVQKSNPLQSLSETGMSLVEFKILDAYLSRIDSHNPDKRFVRFEKGELEKILGVSRILKEDLDTRLDGLFKVVTIRDNHKNKGFTKIALFEKAEAIQDDNGLWQVDLICTPSAMDYIFNIDNMGYLPYMLKNIIELTSRYSYVLYLYLEKNRFRKSWKIELDELKTLLRCTGESYSQFKVFNDRILKKCYKELNEKTTLSFIYEPIKSGRRVTAIRFTVQTLPIIDVAASEIEPEFVDDKIDFLSGAVTPKCGSEPEFTREQMQTILEVLTTIPETKFPRYVPTGNEDFQQYHFLSYLYALMNTHDNKQKPIKNRFAYFLKMLKSEADLQ